MNAAVRQHRAAAVSLLVCLLCTAALGFAYARMVPPWNNPDEPAHWNFIVHLASTGQLPVLEPGDYPEQLIARLKSSHFPPGSPIGSIVYESHQPPLYYALGALLYRGLVPVSLGAAILGVRLLSVAAAMALVAVTCGIAAEIAPNRPSVWVGAAAFVALVPMHVNMAAAIDNDTLGDLLLALFVLLCLRWLRLGRQPAQAAMTGVVLGLGLLTKVTVYVGVPLLAVVAIVRLATAEPKARRREAVALITALASAALVAGWWPIRNMHVYGVTDPLALARNAEVVTQPRTGPLGLAAASRWATISFDSFWGQFGWMGIPLDGRIYRLLFIASALAAAGMVVVLLNARRSSREELVGPLFVALWAVLVVSDVIYYNLTFIQAQGRYLFPAIPAFGLLFVVGLQALVPRRCDWAVVVGVGSSLLLLNMFVLWDVLRPIFGT